MPKSPETLERDRLRAQASGMARSELIDRHRDEYNQLYRFYCEHLGVEPLKPERPQAPPYNNGHGRTTEVTE